MISTDDSYESSKAFERKNSPPKVDFLDFFPSETKGDGTVVKNNARTGAAQGKASFVEKAHCQICGFPLDVGMNDHSGGSIDGNGAGGAIATAVYSVTLASGTVHTENAGSQAYRKGSGCPLCMSKNSTKQRVIMTGGNPWNAPQKFGF